MHDVSRLRRVFADRHLKDVGTTWSQWNVLAFLDRRDGMTQTELAADLDLTKVAIGGLLDRMEAVSLVMRRTDEIDARSRRVYLTRAGKRTLARVNKQTEYFAPYVMRHVSDQELSVALKMLQQVKKTLLDSIDEDMAKQSTKKSPSDAAAAG